MVHRSTTPLAKHAWLIAIAAILIAVLPPEPGWSGPDPLFLFGLIPRDGDALLDSLQNICLYVPFGLALTARGIDRRRVCAAGAALSVATELFQVVIPGRDPNMSDVVANVAGSWVGAILFSSAWTGAVRRSFAAADRHIGVALDPEQRHVATLSLGWAAFVAIVLIASAWFLVPAPRQPPYRVGSPDLDRSGGPIRIGGNGAPDGYFSGLIDEVRIFNSARSHASIAADMLTPVGKGGQRAEGLIAAYGFDAANDATIHDDSEAGHDAAQTGTTWTNGGRFGGALSFGGSGEVLVPHSPGIELRDRWTVEAWIFPIGEPASESTVIAGTGRSFFLYASSEEGRFVPVAGGVFGGELEQVRPSTRIRPDTWTHVALTYDGEALRFYVNGALVSLLLRWAPHRLLNASMNDVPLPPGLLRDAAAVSDALRGQVMFRATLACGAPARTVAPVFFIEGVGDNDVFRVSVAGEDLLVSAETWPRRFRLPSPPSRAEAALRECSPGRRFALEVSGPLQSPRVHVGDVTIQGSSPGIASAWAFILHSELFPEPCRTGGGLAWLAVLLIPFGYLARRTVRTAAGAALMGVAAWVAPPVWHVPPASLPQVIAMVAGIGIGVLLHARARGRESTCPAAAPRSGWS